MPSLQRQLDKLGDDLDALPEAHDPMTLGELDGFIAALIVCPEEVGEDEWLSMIWRDVAEDGETKLDMTAVNALVPGVLEHYRRVLLQLKADEDGYSPVYYVDEDDSLIWQPWAMGFGEAMHLRMEAWGAITANDAEDEDVVAAVVGLMAVVSVANGATTAEIADADEKDTAEFDALIADAADLIPLWVETLFDWRMAKRPEPMLVPVRVAKVGRNDACTCGSGKKYKKCCGANQAD